MFLVGTAMLIFGVGLYSMFVGSKSLKEKGPLLAGSNLFGFFYMKVLITFYLHRNDYISGILKFTILETDIYFISQSGYKRNCTN